MKVLIAESHNLDRPDPLGSHHYIRFFRDAGHDCLWLGPAVSPLHLFKYDALNRHRFKVWREGVRRVDGISWLVPFTLLFYYNLPLLRGPAVGRNQYRFCLPPLRGQLRRAGFGEVDLLWCAGPVAVSLPDLVPHRVSCYRLADRLDRFSGIPDNVGRLQKELIRRVDFVLATSRSLLEWARSVRGEDVYYLPNGVSEIFLGETGPLPADFPSDGKPVAVYAGTLDTRFDLETLSYAVRRVREVHFLLLGPVTDAGLQTGLEELRQERNLTLAGPKQYNSLPAYLQRCAAGLIPFHLNALTEAVNPIKYYEYLASGLPVVAPPMRELQALGGPLHSYSSREEFCSALREAVAGGQERKREESAGLREFAARHTWKSRFGEVSALVEKKLDEKGYRPAD